MGFDDLEAAEKDHQSEEPSESTTEPGEVESSTDSSSSTAESGGDERTATDNTQSDEPGFEFGDVKQSPVYARPEAWTELEDALDLEVVRELREAGIRNEAKRELHDAALRVAARHPEEIADAVREARRED